VQKGAVVVELLAQRAFSPPTQADLTGWVDTYMLDVTAVIDAPGSPNASIMALERRSIAYVVDLKTGVILRKMVGTTNGTGRSAADLAMDYLDPLLP
jgi:hypothetical protein